MDIHKKIFLFIFTCLTTLIVGMPFSILHSQKAVLPLRRGVLPREELAFFNGNTLLPITSPANPKSEVIKKLPVVVTAYSSTVCQTDNDPYITAAGTWVKKGIVANNKFPFGTKIRFPEIYGDRIFVVEDRMHWRKGNYHVDIWFPSYWEAKNFGAKRTYIEVLES